MHAQLHQRSEHANKQAQAQLPTLETQAREFSGILQRYIEKQRARKEKRREQRQRETKREKQREREREREKRREQRQRETKREKQRERERERDCARAVCGKVCSDKVQR